MLSFRVNRANSVFVVVHLCSLYDFFFCCGLAFGLARESVVT